MLMAIIGIIGIVGMIGVLAYVIVIMVKGGDNERKENWEQETDIGAGPTGEEA